MAAPARAPAPAAPPALTETQRSSLLQWLHARGLQQKATTFELLARRTWMPCASQARTRIHRRHRDGGIVCARPLSRPRITAM